MTFFDSPNIQIKCYAVNHYETVPLNITINFADFWFEKTYEVDGRQRYVFVLHWTQQNHQTSKFYIGIEDVWEFEHYDIYLNNLMKICRIAENGKRLNR